MPPILITRVVVQNIANRSNLTEIKQNFKAKDSNSSGFISYHDYQEILKNYYNEWDFKRITHRHMFNMIYQHVYIEGKPIEYNKFIEFMKEHQNRQEQPGPPPRKPGPPPRKPGPPPRKPGPPHNSVNSNVNKQHLTRSYYNSKNKLYDNMLSEKQYAVFVSHNGTSNNTIEKRENFATKMRKEHKNKLSQEKQNRNRQATNIASKHTDTKNRRNRFLQNINTLTNNQNVLLQNRHITDSKGGSKKVRKHQGIYQRGPNKGKLKPGFKYSGKKTKTGLKIIVKVSK